MKKLICSTGIHLGTSKFTCPSCKTDDQRNAVEAFEIAVTQKPDQFIRFCDRQVALTSSAGWSGKIIKYSSGYYRIILNGTRNEFVSHVYQDSAVRKPADLGDIVEEYFIDGESGTIYRISSNRAAIRERTE